MIFCIWCEDLNRGIAKNNRIPWSISEDLKFFKNTTINSTIIMGRKTFDSIGNPLAKRKNIVLTKNKDWKFKNVETCNNPVEILEKYENSKNVVYVIGGKEIYDIFIPHSKQLLVSKLNQSYECDVFMNNDYNEFKLDSLIQYKNFVLHMYKKK